MEKSNTSPRESFTIKPDVFMYSRLLNILEQGFIKLLWKKSHMEEHFCLPDHYSHFGILFLDGEMKSLYASNYLQDTLILRSVIQEKQERLPSPLL